MRKALLLLGLISRSGMGVGTDREVKSIGRQVHLKGLSGTGVMMMMVMVTMMIANTSLH